MELHATGLNAWGQLQFRPSRAKTDDAWPDPHDLDAFTCVLRDTQIGQPRAWLSYTEVTTSSGPITAGFIPRDHIALRLSHNIADTDFAEASNGVVVACDSAGAYRQHSTLRALLAGAQGSQSLPDLQGIVQLFAYDTGFAALTRDGQVFTWGDERYGACLGREMSRESPASVPGLVAQLEDLPTGKIRKIAAGGYALAALTAGNDLYVWGGHPGRPQLVEGMSGEPSPAVVEDQDILDIAAGDSHLVALAANRQVYVVGENKNGQLGLTSQAASAASWTKVDLRLEPGQIVVGVAAGPRNSFLMIQNRRD